MVNDPTFLFLPRDFFNDVLPPLIDEVAMLPDRVPGPDSSCLQSASITSSTLVSSTSTFSTANSAGAISLLESHMVSELTMSALFWELSFPIQH